MPIPKPRKNEEKKDFLERCMSDDVMVSEYDTKQRTAICNTAWKDKNSVKKQSATIMKMKEEFKYFVKIEKAYEEDGEWYVQGIASGTKEDLDDCRMSKEAIQKFVDGLPLPLTDNHAHGDVLAVLGEVVFAELLDDEQMFIKAKLDKDNPSCGYVVKKVSEGKKFAFSIEGMLKKAQTVFSESLDKFVTEYLDIEPEAISITTMPAYEASFLQVVSKSYKKHLDKINKEQEVKEEIKKTAEVEETKVEEVAIEEKVEESEATVEEKKDAVEPPQEVATEEKSKQDEVVETTESADDKLKESQEPSEIDKLKEQMATLTSAVEALNSANAPKKEIHVEQEKTIVSQAVELLAKQNNVIKSLAEKVETLEGLPLKKRTKAKLPDIVKTQKNGEAESLRDLVAKNLV